MAETVNLSDVMKSLPSATEISGLSVMLAGADGSIRKDTANVIQSRIFTPKVANLDKAGLNGVYNIYSSTGTKPCDFGIVLSFSSGSDTYQIAIGYDGHFYLRLHLNKILQSWVRIG